MSTEEENYIEPIFPLTSKEGSSPGEEEDIDLVESFTFGEQVGGKEEIRYPAQGEFTGVSVSYREALDFLSKNQTQLLECFNNGYISTLSRKIELPPIYQLNGETIEKEYTMDGLKAERLLSNFDTTPFYYLFQLAKQFKLFFLMASGNRAYDPRSSGKIDVNADAFVQLPKHLQPATPTVEDQLKWFFIPSLGEIVVRLFLLEYLMVFAPTKFCMSKATGDQTKKEKEIEKKNPEEKLDYLYTKYISNSEKNLFSDFLTTLLNRIPKLVECFFGPAGHESDLDVVLNLAVPFGKNILYSKFLEVIPLDNDDEKNRAALLYYNDTQYFKTTKEFLTEMIKRAKVAESATPGPTSAASSTTPPPPPPGSSKQITCDDVKKLLDDASLIPDKLAITSDQITGVIETAKKAGFTGVTSTFISNCIVGFNTDPANPTYKLFVPQALCDTVKKYLDDTTLVPDKLSITQANIDAIVKKATTDGTPNITELKIVTCIGSLGSTYKLATKQLLSKVAQCSDIKQYLDDGTLVVNKLAITNNEVDAITKKSTTDGFQPIDKNKIQLCFNELNPDPANPVYKFAQPVAAPTRLKVADCNDIKKYLDTASLVRNKLAITDAEIDTITKQSQADGFIQITKNMISNCLFTLNKDPVNPEYKFYVVPPKPANCDDIKKYLDDPTFVKNKSAITEDEIKAISIELVNNGFTPITTVSVRFCLSTLNTDPANPYGIASTVLPPASSKSTTGTRSGSFGPPPGFVFRPPSQTSTEEQAKKQATSGAMNVENDQLSVVSEENNTNSNTNSNANSNSNVSVNEAQAALNKALANAQEAIKKAKKNEPKAGGSRKKSKSNSKQKGKTKKTRKNRA